MMRRLLWPLGGAIVAAGFLAATAFAYSPQNGVLDGFNRADGALGAGWTSGTSCDNSGSSVNAFVIASGAAQDPNSTNGAASCWSTGFTNDEEAFATVSGIGTTAVGLMIRATGTGTAVRCTDTGTAWAISRENGTSSTSLVSRTDVVASAGDKIACTALGSVVTLWRQPGGTGTWVAEASAPETVDTTGTEIGLFGRDPTGKLDDFGGGPYSGGSVVTTTQTISTTIFTGQATVTVGGGGGGTVALGSDCGGTTTDAGGSTIAQAPCTVDIASNGNVAGFVNNLHDDLFVIVGAILGASLIPLIIRWFTAGKE